MAIQSHSISSSHQESIVPNGARSTRKTPRYDTLRVIMTPLRLHHGAKDVFQDVVIVHMFLQKRKGSEGERYHNVWTPRTLRNLKS